MRFLDRDQMLREPLLKPMVDVLSKILGFDDKSTYVEHLFRASLLVAR